MPKQFQRYPEHLRAHGCYCTNNSKTDYNFPGGPKVWNESSNKANYDGRSEHLPALINVLSDPHPIVRYLAATGCLILKDKAV